MTEKSEKEYNIKEEHLDNFIYFRYEMNWLFRRGDIQDYIKQNKEEMNKPYDALISKINSSVKSGTEKQRPPGLLANGKRCAKEEEYKYIENCAFTNGVYVKIDNVKGENAKAENNYEKKFINEVNFAEFYIPSELRETKGKLDKETTKVKSHDKEAKVRIRKLIC